jgi:cyanophycinase-like exopeptidase
MASSSYDNNGRHGIIALMGSGELTASMVEVHKWLLSRQGSRATAVFLDTPAGFQLNADQIGANAVNYFCDRVGASLRIASFKSHESIYETDRHKVYAQLRQADFVLLGPGSPTYTIEQLVPSAIPTILGDVVARGGCLVAASAAALTMGRHTLPVYEIYKVGQKPHWVDGLDILGRFGLNLIVIPHWNNAEGGTHDTSRCFVGAVRFNALVEQLEKAVPILGLDEHTACLIDLAQDSFTVRGVGTISLMADGNTITFQPGTTYPLALLRGESAPIPPTPHLAGGDDQVQESEDFWTTFHRIMGEFNDRCAANQMEPAAAALLALERLLWRGQADGMDAQTTAQARDLFRELLVVLAMRPALTEDGHTALVHPFVEQILTLRQQCRTQRDFAMADALRDSLIDAGIVVEDTAGQTTWRLADKE